MGKQVMIMDAEEYTEIRDILILLQKEIQTLKESIGQRPEPVRTNNALLSSREVLKRLGLRCDDKAWKNIKKTLITEHKMTKIEGGGWRLRQSDLEKFLSSTFI